MRKVSIFGATGSIGQNTIDLIRRAPQAYQVVALTGVAAMLATGVLPYDQALPVLSNPAPWTIAAMFIIMGALVRTGALDAFTQIAKKQAEVNPRLAVALLMAFVVATMTTATGSQ